LRLMAGIFGVFSDKRCVEDLFWGTFYLQHRAQDYCGLAYREENGKLKDITHKGLIRQQFPKEALKAMRGRSGIGAVAGERQPLGELSTSGSMILGFDGNLINHDLIKQDLLREGASFSGYLSPEDVSDSALIAKIISRSRNFADGVGKLSRKMMGDYAIVALTNGGVYAARGWGRKPLIIGRKNGAYAVSSESNSFPNTGFEIMRDVKPGEVVLLNENGVNSVANLSLKPIEYGTFEWIYTAHPASVVDGLCVADARLAIGRALASRYPVEADVVSPTPNSGRWHAIGYAQESKIPYEELYVRYDYSDRSYTPSEQEDRDEEARTKLIPIASRIKGKRIVVVDDSIVRGTQMLNRVRVLTELGAKEIHLRIACPPLMAACRYGKTTKKDEDCIARRMSIEQIQQDLKAKSLCYATVEDLEAALRRPRSELCLDCWMA